MKIETKICSKIRIVVLGSACLWFGSVVPAPDARAQTAAAITVDAAGTCPREEELIRLNPELGDGSATSLQRRMGTPLRIGLQLYRRSSLTDVPVQTQPLGFDDDVEVLLGASIGGAGGGPALVRRMRRPVCGWLNVADIERFTEPMRLIDVPGLADVKDKFGKGGSRLVARVVVKNRIDRETGHGQRAPLFQDPFEGAEPPPEKQRGSIGFFEVLSVFEARRADGGKCRVFRDADCFLRVGATTAGAGNSGMVRTRGWLRGSDVEIWPSALAVHYGAGKRGLKIHEDEQSARVGTPWREANSKERVLALQPDGPHQEPRDRNIVRFPVIRQTALVEPAQGQRKSAAAPADPSSVSYVYEVVFNGQACIEDSTGGKSGCIPEPQIKDQVARLGQVVRAISRIDVLFVVDATESMGAYIRSVVAAIRKHVIEAAVRGEWTLRYSVVLYGDYNRKVSGGLDYVVIPFSGANDLTGLNGIQGVRTFDDENKDKPEAPFAALERAANSAQWDPEAAQRLIVWIGDHGNRPLGSYTTPAGALTETKSAQSVVDAMRAADTRHAEEKGGVSTKTRFVAIQVQGGVTPASQDHFRKFRTDADAIGKALGETIFRTIPAPANANPQQEVSALTKSIADQITRNVEAVGEARQAVLGALGGDTSQRQQNLAPAALLALEYLSQLGFPPERLKDLGRRIQLVRNGFVFQANRNPDFRYWLGLRKPEFLKVRIQAQQLCENIGTSDRVNYVEEAILELVRAVTFTEMLPGETVRDFYARILSVPANRLSLMLEGTPADFVRKWQGMSPRERGDVIAGVCRRAQLLEYVGQGQWVENPDRDIIYDTNRSKASLRPGAALRDFEWRWVTVDARSEWYFIPLEYLP